MSTQKITLSDAIITEVIRTNSIILTNFFRAKSLFYKIVSRMLKTGHVRCNSCPLLIHVVFSLSYYFYFKQPISGSEPLAT